MGFNFPNSPVAAQEVTLGGKTFIYNGYAWDIKAESTATAQILNRIVNPAMQISQENGNTSGIVNGYYPADQWYVGFVTTGAISIQRLSSQATPKGNQNRIRFTVTTADTSIAATEYAYFVQAIEGIRIADFGWGTALARSIVLRFGFRGPAGTYSIAIRNGALDRAYTKSFIISAAQANTDTEQTIIIPGEKTGTWAVDSSVGIYLSIAAAAGANYTAAADNAWQVGSNVFASPGQSNGLGVLSNVFDIFDVGLYLDPDNTGKAPPFVAPDWATEFLACMRYWEKSYDYGVLPGAVSGPGAVGFQQAATSTAHLDSQRPFKVTKRIAPIMTAYNPTTGAAGVRNISAATDFVVASWTWTGTTSTGYISTTAAPAAATQQFAYHYVANARM